MIRRTLLALVVLTLAGCIDTPRKDPPLTRTPSLTKRLGGTPGLTRIADAFVVQILLSDDISRTTKERYLGPDQAAERKHLVERLTALTTRPGADQQAFLAVNIKDPETRALRDAFKRAVQACKIPPPEEVELLNALAPPPA